MYVKTTLQAIRYNVKNKRIVMKRVKKRTYMDLFKFSEDRLNLQLNSEASIKIALATEYKVKNKFDCSYRLSDERLIVCCRWKDANRILKIFRTYKKYNIKG